MEFDRGLELAVTLGWNDLAPGDQLLSARVEYESRRGMPVDLLTVWALRSWGYQDRVCDWTSAPPAHPMGVRFRNNYHSDTLAKALDFIMKNQDQFTRPADAWRPHLVLIRPPAADLVAQAAAWMTEIQASAKGAGGLQAKEGWRASVQHSANGAASDPRITATAANRSCMANRSGFPHGPWCR
jgi:hypothetical protein